MKRSCRILYGGQYLLKGNNGMDKGNSPQNRKKQHLLLIPALCAFCLMTAVVIRYETLPVYSEARPPLALIAGVLAMTFLLLLSFWLAERRSKPAHVFAVGLWIIYIVILVLLAWQVYRDISVRVVTRDTWITLGILIIGILAINGRKILTACRRKAALRRADHVAMGKIYQIMGETHLDRDDDPVTLCHALIEYAVDDKLYETRADISRYVIRKFGRDAFIGREVPVFYDPAEPSGAFASRIDRHFFDE